jgi:hypothetical protein
MKYGEKLSKNEKLAMYKTNYILTFGAFHNSQTNMPSICIPIGHYDLEKAAKKIDKKIDDKIKVIYEKIKILFIGEGIPPSSEDNGLIRYTEAALKSMKIPFEIIVRLHPSESPHEKYNGLLSFENARYSEWKNDSIHQLLFDADVVISHASTVVFEAIYFKKPVFVLQDNNTETYIPKGVGIPFCDSSDLIDLLKKYKGAEKMIGIDNNEYWAEGNVKDNFLNFYNREILKK